MSTYTYTDLINDVKKEAEALRVHATQEERERLDIDKFDARFYDTCIYGGITGSCANGRAHELISKCCKALIDNDNFWPHSKGVDSIQLVTNINYNDLGNVRVATKGGVRLKYLSAIEAYILLPEARNAALIAYLRGETETLDL